MTITLRNVKGSKLTKEEVDGNFEDLDLRIRQRKVTVTAAQLANLVASPVELVPAPGAGKVLALLSPQWAVFRLNGSAPLNAMRLETVYGPHANGLYATNNLVSAANLSADTLFLATQIGGVNGIDTVYFADQPINTDVNANWEIPGPCLTFSPGSGGSGYTVNDVLTADTVDGATFRADAVDGTGAITALTMLTAGTSNASGSNVNLNGGTGSGATVNIDTVDFAANPATLDIITVYTVINV